MSLDTKEFDVLILGAGPAGTACALALKDAGLSVALIDKADFPRDKICGDAIPAPAIRALHTLDPNYVTELRKLSRKSKISHSRVVAPQGIEATFDWKLEAWNIPRLDFDHYLLDLVKQHTNTQILCATPIDDVNITEDGVCLISKERVFKGKIVIACDGAHSILAKKLAGFSMDRNHFCGAVRIYFSGIDGSDPSRNEFFFSRKMMPGYFWLFPVADNLYNVGFGMLSKTISKRKINLEKALYTVIDEFPELKRRFAHAKAISKPQGMGLPIGTRRLKLSGDRFLLCGDAASLIDPVSGAGIDTAMLSGMMAADHIRKNWQDQPFTASVNRAYDRSIYKKFGKTFRKNTRLLRILSRFPRILPLGLKIISLGIKRKRNLQES
ncbi:MAG TPA: hypothetical protein DIW47_06860 [Bacteroidetes bacterium]|nr:hypothetical protein [Bacteroidota bacterium]